MQGAQLSLPGYQSVAFFFLPTLIVCLRDGKVFGERDLIIKVGVKLFRKLYLLIYNF